MVVTSAHIGEVEIGRHRPLALIAGPCVIESRDHTLRLADAIGSICRDLGIPFVFKASFDKANRSTVDSFRGPGIEAGLAVLGEVRSEAGIPVLTDVHLPQQVAAIGEVVDCIQIPAFLCRQTDLLIAAGRSGRCVNIKKGQFMSPEQMGHAVAKVASTDNDQILLTERGTFFGYHRLVNDMTAISIMQQSAPVVFDATHSCQLPGGEGHQSGGHREHVGLLAAAGIAAGADALFLEVHDTPDQALSDPATVYPLDELTKLLVRCQQIAAAVRD